MNFGNQNDNQDRPANPWRQPSQLVVQPNGEVFNGGTLIGNLVSDDNPNRDVFDQLRTVVARHYEDVTNGNQWYNPGVNPVNPARILSNQVQDQDDDERHVHLDPRPPSPADDHEAILALQDQQFQALQDMDQNRCIENRVTYLNRLLVRKLELDFT